MHAIRVADSYDRFHTYVLVLRLRPLPRAVHGGAAGRAFEVTDAYPLDVARAALRGGVWVQSLQQLRSMQRHAEACGATRFGATMLECEPLAVQTVPFGTGPTRGPIQENWKEDIREGRRATRLLEPQPLFGM
ncbi:hypothetical protein EIP86_000706 [Pleurotus ostreatoroseus]|nr:hypothetical protein EIP86_000706 [Pleurotus ostreatoroseus]